jgi:hypothetical protein
MSDLERRAKHCTTHHHGCDCREWKHQHELARKDVLIREAREVVEALLSAGNADRYEVVGKDELGFSLNAMGMARHKAATLLPKLDKAVEVKDGH